MLSENGGYRRPRKPAAVSGPGKHARRTDGGPGVTLKQAARYMQGDEYGESKELNELATSADLAAAPGTQDAPRPSVEPRADVVPLTDPTGRPDEPITTGLGMNPVQPVIPPAELADAVRAAYVARPSQATLRLLEAIEAQEQ